MRIAIGNDHAGTVLKKRLLERMRANGHSVTDHGAPTEDSVDYPDFAHPVALAVQNGKADLGVLICGSGNGVNMAANRHHGVRSALAWNTEVATLARTHNDANIIALPSRFVDASEAERILDAFLAAHFEGGRHQRRVAKIEAA